MARQPRTENRSVRSYCAVTITLSSLTSIPLRAYCSSAVRAKETAKLCLGALSQHLGVPPPSCDVLDAIEEIHMGGTLFVSSRLEL